MLRVCIQQQPALCVALLLLAAALTPTAVAIDWQVRLLAEAFKAAVMRHFAFQERYAAPADAVDRLPTWQWHPRQPCMEQESCR